jgi:hypothetical protein
MAEESQTKRKRTKPTYSYKQNAVNVTIYSLQGETIPASVRKEFEEAVTQIALANNLVINIALT